tara:strand:- start:1035 stop:1724 length:690 start_codon:yes stop_codon:yes gene_type:complete
MDKYEIFIDKLDEELIELLSIRQKYLLNSKNYKVFELGGYNMVDRLSSNLDCKLYNSELKYSESNQTLKSYEKNFNEDLFKNNINELEDLNLNNIIKQVYINFLYDICKYGDDINKEEACEIDINLLYKISERVHFGYEVIKYKYFDNKQFYNDLLETTDNSLITYYLTNSLKQVTYLDKIKKKCLEYDVNDILVCTFYKHFIIPFYIETQLHFCKSLKKIKNNLNKTS